MMSWFDDGKIIPETENSRKSTEISFIIIQKWENFSQSTLIAQQR
jgi:hypothetical protein